MSYHLHTKRGYSFPAVSSAMQKAVRRVFNPAIGEYDVRAAPGQATGSKREQLVEALTLIITQAPAHLLPGGWLLLEHGYDQAQALRTLLQQAGFEQVQSRRDLAGLERCSGGRLAQD